MNFIKQSKLSLWILMTLLVISTTFTSYQPAKAQTLSFDFEEIIIIDQDKQAYFDKVVNSTKEQEIEVHNDLNEVKSYSVYGIKDSNDVILTLAFEEAKNSFNVITAVLENGETLNYFQETIGSYNPDSNTGHALAYLNGELVVDETFIENEDDVSTEAITWNGFTNCMENQGVPGWVVTTISIACGVVCAATLGTGCLVCALGVAEVWAVQIGYCLGIEITN